MKYSRRHQSDLGIAQPISVLWAALAAVLSEGELARVKEAYQAQSRRYQRACELNKMARWVERASSRPQSIDTVMKLERRRAALADPMAYVNGEQS